MLGIVSSKYLYMIYFETCKINLLFCKLRSDGTFFQAKRHSQKAKEHVRHMGWWNVPLLFRRRKPMSKNCHQWCFSTFAFPCGTRASDRYKELILIIPVERPHCIFFNLHLEVFFLKENQIQFFHYMQRMVQKSHVSFPSIYIRNLKECKEFILK